MNTIVLAGSISDNLASAMSNQTLWTNIAKTVIFILLGFIFTKKNLLPEKTGTILTKFVMGVCLPCLAFCSFMKDFTITEGVGAIVNFVLGFVFYILFIFLGKAIFLWVKDKNKREVLAVLFAFGSTTFFAYPLVSAIYGKTASNYFNIMNVAYRVFLYSYAYMVVSGVSLKKNDNAAESDGSVTKEQTTLSSIMKKVFLNPILIATFAGLFLWVLQAIPGSDLVRTDWLSTNVSESKVAFWRIDVTLPWIYQSANTLGNLSSTLILFAIGCTLGKGSPKEAAMDKYAWIWTAIKIFAAPAIVLAILFGIEAIAKACGYANLITIETVQSSVFTWLVPPATVAVGYCLDQEKEPLMASHISLISTFGAVLGVIIWVIILVVVESSGFFPAIA